MFKIFDLAAHVSTPLSLAGIFSAIFFYILRQILRKKDSKAASAKTDILIVNRLFILSLISMLLGFSGWALQILRKGPKPSIQFNVYVNDKPVEGIVVTADNVGESSASNRDGKVILFLEAEPLPDSLHLIFEFTSQTYKIDSTISVSTSNYPRVFRLFPKIINADVREKPSERKIKSQPPTIIDDPAGTGNFGIEIYSNTIRCRQQLAETGGIVSQLSDFPCNAYYFDANNEYQSKVIIGGFTSVGNANRFGVRNRTKILGELRRIYLLGNIEWEIIDLSKPMDNRIQLDDINKASLKPCENYPVG
jgi:hypothetical protein